MDFICDLDGTLCNVDHRRAFVKTKPKNWMAFNEGIYHDTPNFPVLVLCKLIMKSKNNRLIFCSGRSEEYRLVTEKWLMSWEIDTYDKLYMRKSKDYRPDDIVKLELLDQMIIDGYRPSAAIDDRKKVCDAWRSRGLFLFDVSQGQGDF